MCLFPRVFIATSFLYIVLVYLLYRGVVCIYKILHSKESKPLSVLYIAYVYIFIYTYVFLSLFAFQLCYILKIYRPFY